MVEVRGRPFLEWLLLRLAQRDGIRRVILATGHLGEIIEQHFGPQPWCGVHISFSHESKPLGTGGALRLAASHAQSANLLVLNGDTYCDYDSTRLFELHLANMAAATLWLSTVTDSTRFGNVAVDVDGRITGFREKTPTQGRQLASAGAYLMRRDVIATIQPDRAVSLELEVFPSLVRRGLYGVVGSGPFVDIGTPESLKSASGALESEFDGLNCT